MAHFLNIPDARVDFKNDVTNSDLADAELANRPVAFKSFVSRSAGDN